MILRLSNCFEVTSVDFEQIINNDFIQLEAELLNYIKYFLRETKKQKPRSFSVKSHTSFSFHFL